MTVNTIFCPLSIYVPNSRNSKNIIFSLKDHGNIYIIILQPIWDQSTQNAILCQNDQNAPSQPKVDQMSKLVKTALK